MPMHTTLLALVVFICGGSVMILELVGSRVLAPYMGTSTIIWTSLIGIILGSLSLGYWWGGQWSDKNPSPKVLSSIIFMSACLILLISFTNDIVLQFISLHISDLRLSTVIGASILFIAPSVLLGMVSPFAVRIQMESVAQSGKLIGRLYAISTIGSIVGTFLAGFWLIPTFGIKQIFILLAVLLVFASILTIAGGKWIRRTVVTVLLIGLSLTLDSSKYLYGENLIRDVNSDYSRIWIFDVPGEAPEYAMRFMQIGNENSGAIYLNKKKLVNRYLEFYRLSEHFKSGPKQTLMIGGGASVCPMDFLERNPDSTMDVVEIDPTVTRLAKEYFGLKDSERLSIYDEDGRIFLNRNQKQYDIVFIDAFKSAYSIPHHLTTVESMRHVHAALKEDGIAMMNMIGAVEGPNSQLFQSIYKTIESVFPQTRVFLVRDAKEAQQVQNILLVAFKVKNDHKLYSNNSEMNKYLRNLWYEEIRLEDAILLTDNYAPVEGMAQKALPNTPTKSFQFISKIKSFQYVDDNPND